MVPTEDRNEQYAHDHIVALLVLSDNFCNRLVLPLAQPLFLELGLRRRLLLLLLNSELRLQLRPALYILFFIVG